MFPNSWYESPIDGNAKSLHPDRYEHSFSIINKAMSKYPKGFLENYIKKVYVLDELNFYGVSYGGTNSDDAVYIVNQGYDMGYTDVFLEQTFHHEFSSILFRNYPQYFNNREWTKNNKGFTYGSGGVNAIIDGSASTELSYQYAKMGVLCQYAKSDIEEDFNTFAEQLFLSSDSFWDMVNSFPALNNKLKIIVRFYYKINSKFTEEYFREISKE